MSDHHLSAFKEISNLKCIIQLLRDRLSACHIDSTQEIRKGGFCPNCYNEFDEPGDCKDHEEEKET